MSSHTDDEWTILNPTTQTQVNMDATQEVSGKTEAPTRDCTINIKPDDHEKKHSNDCFCEAKPALLRKDSMESIEQDYRRPRRTNRIPPPPRHYTPSPQRYFPAPSYSSFFVNSSTRLLEGVGKEDGIVELPAPAVRNVYLSTFPFGDKDVKKWSWLLASGVEDEYVAPSTRDMNGDMPSVERIRQSRGDFPIYTPGTVDIPSVYLSRALDVDVVPEESKHNVRYLIIVQNRHRPQGWKLLVAETRKAAGVLLYYEILKGDSIMFVGATVHQCKSVHPKKYKKVDSLEEAVSAQDEGFVGVVC